ncbi:ArsR/SmtB family transcription factor [Paenibacillus humicola]|uniref:ArsR/SmtB family transcription factor n=1 Tax=Paenibacillus humicola TaxID=3110540 RepID=UPI00237BA4FD|nr:winged helix-turn-helix domain-containing protein [Paenibacillus humicola]
MEQYFIITTYDQLKAVSDPFRVKILSLLIEGSYTGQQIAQILEIPRAKIHYHLNELEKNGFINVVRTEVKNGIVQKFFRAVAYGFRPADDLLPYTAEVGDLLRQTMLEVLNRARLRVLSAPDEAFQNGGKDASLRPRIGVQAEMRVREDQFVQWLARFRELLDEFDRMDEAGEDDENAKWYYFSAVGLQIDEPRFTAAVRAPEEAEKPEKMEETSGDENNANHEEEK